MGRYLRKKCKGVVVGEIAVVGVKTRARAALSMAAITSSSSSSPAKKIKKVSKTSSYNCNYQLRNRRRNLSLPEKFAIKEEVANCSSSEVITDTTLASSGFPPSCCSSNGNDQSSPSDVVMDRCIADPEVESGEASSRYIDCHATTTEGKETREEATKSNCQDYHSPVTKLPDAKSTVQIKVRPSDSEIEEFFAAAENDLRKRFIDKYNFDIVNDVPLEGRYEWVPIKP